MLKAKFPPRAGTYCENLWNWNASNVLSLRLGGGDVGTILCSFRGAKRALRLEEGSTEAEVDKSLFFMVIFNKTSFMSKY